MVIGAAFASVVGAFTKDLLTPLITAIVGKEGQFSALTYKIRGSEFAVGDFINAAISFLLVAAAVYFFVVTPINALVARMRKSQAPAYPTTKKCPECLSEIPIDARRCAHCSQPVAGKAACPRADGYPHWRKWPISCKINVSHQVERNQGYGTSSEICGKGPQFGNNISHAHNVTKRRWERQPAPRHAKVGAATRRMRVCTSGPRSGKVGCGISEKPPKSQRTPTRPHRRSGRIRRDQS